MNVITQPSEHMGAYSAIPLRVFDTDAELSDNYKYIINILWDKVEFSGTSSANINGIVLTSLLTTTPHSFTKGDTVFVNDIDNGDEHTNYYIVRSIIDEYTIVLDILWEIPYGPNLESTVSRVIKYKLNPDLENECKLDLSNTLKDFVSQNLDDTISDLPFLGDTTRFDYDLSIGSESQYVLRFEDNRFEGGNVGFLTESFTGVTDTPFQIGDQIQVSQDIEEWPYTDNFFFGGNIGFTGTTNHNFLSGQTIQVVGQVTNPQYNGFTTIVDVPTSDSLVTSVGFGFSSPVEGGSIYGTSRPSYNGVSTIIDIVTATTGVILVVDKPFTTASGEIGGSIRFADGRITPIFNEASISDLKCYNAHINRLDYTVDSFEPYYIDPVDCTGSTFDNKISTFLTHNNPSQKYRIEPSTKSFLLTHTDTGSTSNGLGFDFYNSNNELLGKVSQQSIFYEDMYSPIGLEQLATNIGSYIQLSGVTSDPFTSYSGSVDNYSVYLSSDCGDCCECDIYFDAYYKDLTTELEILYTKQSGTLGGYNYFYGTLSGGTIETQLWYIDDITPAPDRGWYLTERGVTEFSAVTQFYAYDKANDTFCPVLTDTQQEWAAPVSSIIGLNINQGFTFILDSVRAISEKVWFEINDDCSDYEVYHLMWKDRYGSWLSYPFIYWSKDFTEVERSTYYKTEGNWNDDTYGYDPYGRGETQYFGRSRDKVTINSGWVKDYENDLIKDLLESTSVYLQDPEGRLLACILEEKSLEFKKNNQIMIYNYTMSVRLSNNEVRF